ncbi:hypothetical protein KSS88_18430 [Bacillus altitudinis]|nr:hypothetical protein [Bacillus altitudinis]MBU8970824.1 hypothetical protein [Bacillus altitudinis]
MTENTKEIQTAFQNLSYEVSRFIGDLYNDSEPTVSCIKSDLVLLGKVYGSDLALVEEQMQQHNDIPAKAEKLLEDPLVYLRIVGSLAAHLGSIAAVLYDPEQGLVAVEVLVGLLGTVLVLEAAGY